MATLKKIESTRQLWRLIRHEPPTFLAKLLKNAAVFGTHKYVLHRHYLTKNIHGYRMQFDLQDPGISRSLLLVGDREREHRFMLKTALKPGMTVLDLGANLGYYVLMEHQLMQHRGRVIAVEPSPYNFRLLKKNIYLNNEEARTILINAAAAAADGTANLYLSQLSNVHSLIAHDVPHPTEQYIAVTTLSLATLQQKHGPIDLIRMDIEGYELVILQSLLELNRATNTPWLPGILFELHPPKYDRPAFNQLLADLDRIGYTARLLACSHKEALAEHNLTVIAGIPTDGTTRYIAENIPLPALQKLALRSRAVLLKATL